MDSGPLYASIDRSDGDHARSVAVLQQPGMRPLVPALVVAEVTYFVAKRLGSATEAAFLEGLEDLDVQSPTPGDWRRIAELVRQYAGFPLGGTDASVVALAERLNTNLIITLDRRHFSAIRPRHCPAFRILPD